MAMSVAGFAFGRVAEVAGNLRITLDVGDLRKIEIPAIRHGFAGECIS